MSASVEALCTIAGVKEKSLVALDETQLETKSFDLKG